MKVPSAWARRSPSIPSSDIFSQKGRPSFFFFLQKTPFVTRKFLSPGKDLKKKKAATKKWSPGKDPGRKTKRQKTKRPFFRTRQDQKAARFPRFPLETEKSQDGSWFIFRGWAAKGMGALWLGEVFFFA